MNKPKVLIGVTGSVASTLLPKMVDSFNEFAEVRVVTTERAKPFYNRGDVNCKVYDDILEWRWITSGTYGNTIREEYKKGDSVLHIELRNWADVFVIAPLSANTMAKMTYGMCDNLLTSVFLAWDWTKPVVIAPAMNTLMWSAEVTQANLHTLRKRNVSVVPPVTKLLACADEGMGAMADISDICDVVRENLRWSFPLEFCYGIPVGRHPGAFGYVRKHSQHSGVDLYTRPSEFVRTVEGGVVVGVEAFTGPQDNSPWWNDTWAVLVEGRSGVVLYGEIEPVVKVGMKVKRGEWIGRVLPVLPAGRERPDIPGHSRWMLHMELYTHGRHAASVHKPKEAPFPDFMRDATPLLLASIGAPCQLPEFE